MKKLIFLLSILICGAVYGQGTHKWDSVVNPTGTDTTYYKVFYTSSPALLVFHSEYLSADDGTIEVGYAVTDSALLVPFWIDQDLDGSNDLPVTLTAALKQYAIAMPFGFEGYYMGIKWTPGSVTENLHYYIVTHPRNR